jgi:hypothetical protein
MSVDPATLPDGLYLTKVFGFCYAIRVLDGAWRLADGRPTDNYGYIFVLPVPEDNSFVQGVADSPGSLYWNDTLILSLVAAPEAPDWRPDHMTPEDYYA